MSKNPTGPRDIDTFRAMEWGRAIRAAFVNWLATAADVRILQEALVEIRDDAGKMLENESVIGAKPCWS